MCRTEEGKECNVPLRPITHRKDELAAYKKHAGKAEDHEYVQPNAVAKWIELWI